MERDKRQGDKVKAKITKSKRREDLSKYLMMFPGLSLELETEEQRKTKVTL
jgi:hypothetical protein